MKLFFFEKRNLHCFSLMVFLIFGIATNTQAQIDLPEPTGDFGIGTTIMHFEDTARQETYSPEPDDYRQIMVQIWYPIQKDTTGVPAAYMDAQSAAYFLDPGAMPAELSDMFRTVTPHALDSVPPLLGETPFPVLIFSPGYGCNFQFYQNLIEEIVSRGYVVAAINHPYISAATLLADGAMIEGNNNITPDQMTADHAVLVADILFLVSKLDGLQIQGFPLSLDIENIGFFGHSIGGSAAVEVALQLDQAKGAINIDGTLFGTRHQESIHKPVFLMVAQDHTIENDESWSTAWENIGQNGYLMTLEGSTHHTVFDYGYIFSQILVAHPEYEEAVAAMSANWPVGTIDPQLSLDINSDYIVAFFDMCLKGASVDTIKAIDYPEATFETTRKVDDSNNSGCFISILSGCFISILTF